MQNSVFAYSTPIKAVEWRGLEILGYFKKTARRSGTAYENTWFVLPRERQTYKVTSTNHV